MAWSGLLSDSLASIGYGSRALPIVAWHARDELLRRYCAAPAQLTREQVAVRVMKVVEEFPKVAKDKVNSSASFSKDLGLDSLDQVELVLNLEDEFSIVIPDTDADKIGSVQDVIEYVSVHPKAK